MIEARCEKRFNIGHSVRGREAVPGPFRICSPSFLAEKSAKGGGGGLTMKRTVFGILMTLNVSEEYREEFKWYFRNQLSYRNVEKFRNTFQICA